MIALKTGVPVRDSGKNEVAFAPRTPAKIVSRGHLIELLEQSTAPLVIVRAPGGTGKSTLVAEWVQQYPRAGVWVSIDPSASHRFAFWRRVLDAITDAGLAHAASILGSTVPSTEMTSSLRGVLLRGFNTLPPITIVLEDFHEITDPEVHEDLLWLLRSGAPVHLVIVTRTVSQLENAENLSRLDTLMVLMSDLAFTLDEVRACALTIGADPAVANELLTLLDGWALPTRTALLELASGRASTAREAVDLIQSTGDRLPTSLDRGTKYCQFLLRTSVARRLTLALAREIGGPDADLHLARLEAEGFGGWAAHSGHPEFSIHPIVREMLEREMLVRLPTELPALRIAYARDREANGDPLAAAQQYAAIGDLRSVVGLIRRHYGELVVNQMDGLVELLRAADSAALRQHPELIAMLLMQASRNPGTPRVGILQLATLGMASAQARFGRGDPVEQLSLLTSLLASQRLSGNYSSALATAQKIVFITSTLDDDRRDALRGVLPTALTHAATTSFYADELGEAGVAFNDAAVLSRLAHRDWVVTHAESMQSLVDATGGDMRSARSRIDAAQARTSPQAWRGTYSAAGHHLAAAYDALERFDSEAARAELGELSDHEATIEHWPIIAHLRAVAALIDRAPSFGLAGLERDIAQHAARPSTSESMQMLLAAGKVDLLLADRQPERAAAALPRSFHGWRAELARARLDYLAANYASALAHATPIARSAEFSARARATALLTVAAAASRMNQAAAASESGKRAIDLLRATGLRRPLLAVPLNDLRLVFSELGSDAEALLSAVPDVLPAPLSEWNLTPAELRVLSALRTTASIDGLAAQLHLSSNTVKTHLRQVYRKLGASSRDEALAVASLNGIAESVPHATTERRELP